MLVSKTVVILVFTVILPYFGASCFGYHLLPYSNTTLIRDRRQVDCRNTFTCKTSGDCVFYYKVCDGKSDCSDGSDETFAVCKDVKCRGFKFRCTYGACVDGDSRCNGLLDCADGSDEDPDICQREETTPRLTAVPPSADGSCPAINIPNGKYEALGSGYTPEAPIPNYAVVKLSCNANYALYPSGKSLVICIEGVWNIPVPQCKRICPARISSSVNMTCTVDGSLVDCNQPLVEGAIVRSKCKQFYAPSHAEIPISMCSGGSWNNPLIRCIPECGEVISDSTVNSINNTSVNTSKFPWHIGLYRYIEGIYGCICGGSIITSRHIITAAFCFSGQLENETHPAKEFYVAAYEYYKDYNISEEKPTQTNEVKEYHIPPQFKGPESNFAGDIAVVVLVKELQWTNVVRPVCIEWDTKIESQQLKPNNIGTVVGWSVDLNKLMDETYPELQQFNAAYTDFATCLDVEKYFQPLITPDKFCARFTNGSEKYGFYTGGAGLVFEWKENNRRKYYIRGVATLNHAMGDKYFQYGPYTKISDYYDFIRNIVSSNIGLSESEDCPELKAITHGKFEVLGESYKQGTPVPNHAIVQFTCDTNYALCPANPLVTCRDNIFTTPIPQCERTCPARISSSVDMACTVDGNLVDCNQPLVEGAIVKSKCKQFYTSSHAEILISVCSEGSWNNPLIRCIPECGEVISDSTVSPTNNTSVKTRKFPWYIGLYHYMDGIYGFRCGGSIITPRHIITAAFCFTADIENKTYTLHPAQDFYVAAYEYYMDYKFEEDKLAQKNQVKEYHIPPQFKGPESNFAGDIAVVVLLKEFQWTNVVRPVCIEWDTKIESQQLKPNNIGTVVGWGLDLIEPMDKTSPELQHFNAPYIDFATCLDIANDFEQVITPDKLCAGFTNGSDKYAFYAGGAGLVFEWKENNRRKYYIRGVATFNHEIGDKYFQYKYIKISAYYDFIRNIVSSNIGLSESEDCPELKAITHGKFEVLEKSYKPGTPVPNHAIVQFSCDTNYVLRPANPLVTCRDGSFTTPIPQCDSNEDKVINIIDKCGSWDENAPAPWNVAIYYKPGNNYIFRCGGSIITAKLIITAAQCLIDKNQYEIQLPAEEFYVAAGKYYNDYNAKNDKAAQKSQVKEYHISPEFDGSQSNYRGDVAVVVLKNSFNLNNVIQPVCLNRNIMIAAREGPPNNQGIVVGWPRKYIKFDEELTQSNTTYIDKEQCFDIISSPSHVLLTSDKFCARYIRCGNFGGGMAYKLNNNNKQQFYIYGVNSFVDNRGVCDDSNTGIFTNIAFHKEFILKIIDRILSNDSCPSVTIENGHFSVFDSIPSYTLAVQFTCNANYTLYPMNPLVACSDGNWTAAIPQCKLTCPPIISSSVEVMCSVDGKPADCSEPLVEGAVVTSRCKPFYTQSGYHNIPVANCKKGFWSNPLIKCVPACGEVVSIGVPHVVNGTSAKIGEFPWHVGLYRLEKGNHKYKCGGSIINPQVIITAAHCLTDEIGSKNPADEYYVGAGKYYSDYNSADDLFAQKRQVKEYHIPTEYKGFVWHYAGDLAIVVVRQPFQMSNVVQPVCVDWDGAMEHHQLKPNNVGSVVGWGYVDPNVPKESAELKKLNPPFIDREKCYDEVPTTFRRWITLDKFCAGFQNGSSICIGDSGGGLVFKWNINNNDKYFIRGVVSVGPVGKSFCDNFQYGVYTKISHYLNNNFIQRIIAEVG